MINSQRRRGFADFTMTTLRFRAELEHSAKNGDTLPIGIEFHQGAQGRFH